MLEPSIRRRDSISSKYKLTIDYYKAEIHLTK
jgi:hypothetical protein